MFAPFMVNAWIVATVVAVVAGVVGFFVVLRGAAFVADAVPTGAFAGAAGASLVGVNTLIGLAVFAVAQALGIGMLSRRGRRDVATALTLVMMLGLGALFLSFTTQYASEIFSLLFGELLGVSSGELLPTAVLGLACLTATALLYRPLLLTTIAPEVAEGRGVSVRALDVAFLVVVALATSLTVPVAGALLIFSLMIGPPAAARSVTSRPLLAIGVSVLLALGTVWTAIAASFETNWPVGFFVGTLGAACYAAGRGWSFWRNSRATSAAVLSF
jgi:zinc/manganese transport system permease protein